jgi:mannitol/fructose-specific phosphotransferase system IIA component (Ntr-type)
MGEIAVLFTIGLVTLTIGWYFLYGRARTVRAGAIFHTFARLGELQHAGLDAELRGIVKEKGLREEDPYDEVVARAKVLDLDGIHSFQELITLAAERLSKQTGVPVEQLSRGFEDEMEAGFMPVARGAALPHLRIGGAFERPTMLIIRSVPGVTIRDAAESVHAIFFLLSPEDEPGQHLRLLGHLATHVDDHGFLERWLDARDADELRGTLLREERSLSLHLDRGSAAGDLIDRALVDLDLPGDALVALIRRGGHGIIPHGSTVLAEGDRLTVIGGREAIRKLAERYGLR